MGTNVKKYVKHSKMPKAFQEVVVKEYQKIIPKQWVLEKLQKWFIDNKYEVEVVRDDISGESNGFIGLKKGFKIALQEQFELKVKHSENTTNIKLEFWGRTQKKAALLSFATVGVGAAAVGGSVVSQHMQSKKFLQAFSAYLDSIVGHTSASETSPATPLPSPPPSPPPSNVCNNCKSPVQDGWKACPACGRPLSLGPSECPTCDAQVQSGWKACPSCGDSLTSGPSLGGMKTCLSCGQQVGLKYSVCPYCNEPVSRQPPPSY